MKRSEDHPIKSLDEQVFENRNKAYGAFQLRIHYSDNLLKSLFLTEGGILILVLLLCWYVRLPDPIIAGLKDPGTPPVWTDYIVPLTPPKPDNPSSAPPSGPARNYVVGAVHKDSAGVTKDTTGILTGIVRGVSGTDSAGTGTSGIDTAATESGPLKIEIFVQQMPEFPGGFDAMNKFLSKNIMYPETAREYGESARAAVSFVVDPEGNIIMIEAVTNRGYGFEQEIIRVLKKMPKWKPGKNGDRGVYVRMVLPVTFEMK